MLQIAICDDNPLHLAHAARVTEQELVELHPSIEGFSDAAALLQRVRETGYAPDVAILDIEMERQNGIALAKELNRLTPDCQIVFLTAYAEYASQVYETRHVWMVLKSQMEEYMGRALRSALDAAEKKDEPVLLLKSRSETLRIPLGEILYLSRVGRKAQIVTRTGVFYSSRRPSELLYGELAAGFVRCHQGYWVNEAGIVGLERDTFLLADGSRIPISRSYRDASRGRFFARYR